MNESNEWTRQGRRREKKKKKGRIGFILILLLAIIAVAGTYYASKINTTINSITQSVGNRTEEEANDIIKNAKPINILLLGIDNGAYGRTEEDGRSDTMLLLTVNPTTKKSQLLSIPRDTYTEIVGTGSYDKLNHAYAYGKAHMVINSVEKLLDTTIDFYVQINMEGLIEFVDSVGGIEVTSPLTFTYENRTFVEGKTEVLDGTSALKFARMRYDDPDGDYGRQKRQRIVIEKLVEKLMRLSSVTNFEQIMNAVSKNVKTDIPLGQVMAFKNTYGPAVTNDNLTQAFMDERQLLLTNNDGQSVYYSYATDEVLIKTTNAIRTILEEKNVKTYPLLEEREDLYYLTTP